MYDTDKIVYIIGEIVGILMYFDMRLFIVFRLFFYHKLDKTFYGTLISCLFLT